MVKAIAELSESAKSLLEAVGDTSDVTLLRSWGNRGDDLIYAGTRRLLRDYSYREYDIRNLNQAPEGKTAIITGGGAWCKPYHAIAEMLPAVSARFSRVIVFPSSFDTEEPLVRKVLSQTRAVVFARERESYEQIRPLCDARLVHGAAFFFDFTPFKSGFHQGVLNAFRLDTEATGAPIPEKNRDISQDCATLDEWLWTISRHDLIRTDRAHVAIAAALLGRRVEYRPSSYHKMSAIVRFSISSDQVALIEERDSDGSGSSRPAPEASIVRGGRLETESSPLEQRLAAREAELAWASGELRESRRALKAMRESWSWRLTSPLRVLLGLSLNLRRLLRRTI
jgi:exopolysaccharide biosynthesis predicted pyruvyltransferase EpsI